MGYIKITPWHSQHWKVTSWANNILLLWNPEVHYYVHKKLTVDLALSQLNLIYIHPHSLRSLSILSSLPKSSKWPFSWGFWTKFWTHHTLLISFSLLLSLVIWGESTNYEAPNFAFSPSSVLKLCGNVDTNISEDHAASLTGHVT
jgi:hypothetical protein